MSAQRPADPTGTYIAYPCPECGHDDNVIVAHDIDGLVVECLGDHCGEFIIEDPSL